MPIRRTAFLAAALAAVIASTGGTAAQAAQAGVQVFASCPVTVPNADFVPPSPYPSKAPGRATSWHGTPRLWTMLYGDGNWHSLPRNPHGFRQKVFWWSPGYDGRTNPVPKLTVRGRRLDGDGSFVSGPATNAHDGSFGGWAMLTGVDVPSAGCWELTGEYGGDTLTFVVSIANE